MEQRISWRSATESALTARQRSLSCSRCRSNSSRRAFSCSLRSRRPLHGGHRHWGGIEGGHEIPTLAVCSRIHDSTRVRSDTIWREGRNEGVAARQRKIEGRGQIDIAGGREGICRGFASRSDAQFNCKGKKRPTGLLWLPKRDGGVATAFVWTRSYNYIFRLSKYKIHTHDFGTRIKILGWFRTLISVFPKQTSPLIFFFFFYNAPWFKLL